MSRQFGTIQEFVRFWDTRTSAVEAARLKGMQEAGRVVAEAAKAMIGEYQPEVGPFPEWAPLAYTTLHGGVSPSGFRYKGKIELGFSPPDNPLLRDGTLRNSIYSAVEGMTVTVGVPHEIASPTYGPDIDIGLVALWMEFGTVNMPPRPFIGPAMVRHGRKAAALVMGRMLMAMVGRDA